MNTNTKKTNKKFTFSFQWHITDDCDQRCKHCYIFSADNCKPLESMNWEQMEKTFYNCLDFCDTYNCRPYLYLTGGDPILHLDFWRLLELFHERKIYFTILGNPFHLSEEVCKRLKSYGCERYQMSIDGLRETHDWFRKPGSFDCTLEKLTCLKNAGIRTAIMTTVSKTNLNEISGIIDEVVTAGANVFAFSRYVPSGGGLHIPETAEEGIIYDGCHCGNSHLTILPSGDVYACRRVSNSRVGNVYEDKLADIWIGSMESYREFDKFSKCSKCRLLPWCRGCPAVAKGTNGDFYTEDPQCWIDTSPCHDELISL